MARKPKLTDRQIAALPRKPRRYVVSDPEQRSLYLRVPPSGPIVFTAVVKLRGKQTWKPIATTDEIKIDEAREKTREIVKWVKAGKPPPKPPPQSVAVVAENWLVRVVTANHHRTAVEQHRVVRAYVTPHLGHYDFASLRRADIAQWLDHVQDHHGTQQADRALATLRAIAGWVQTRDDTYVPPFTRGMRRTPRQEHSRARILDDDELRKVWIACGEVGAFGAFVKLLLLTAQRRAKVLRMRWDDLHGDVWVIRTEAREKGNADRLRLPQIAIDIIRAQPHLAASPYVFAVPFSQSRAKRQLDCLSGVTGWRLHDLRRTSRSLLSRLGVQERVAEAVLGHVVGGVRGIYDRHPYFDEKAHALRELAGLIERLVNPPSGNVLAMRS